ncbi:unnamed protein product [Angiostrongylus costaricensis]|uniref:histone acetyltransferase n=1 Tax=Angiostrongylus costaricensis TaxID=334426 RepID=A0A0R3PFS4_ANGCS|nr:unnamed protein product [Angiostrongylus costaricensis]
MLEKGVAEKTIVEFKDIYKQVGDEDAGRREEVSEVDEGDTFQSVESVLHVLVTHQSALLLPDIADPDPPVASDMMDDRNTILERARDEHWEFSLLRRAKFSTMASCRVLHESDAYGSMSYTCNKSGVNCRDFVEYPTVGAEKIKNDVTELVLKRLHYEVVPKAKN